MLEPIRVAPNDPDWYYINSDEILSALAGVPSIRVRRGQWQIHRSHLPLLSNVIEALRLIAPPTADLAARTALDEQTRARGYTLRAHQHSGSEFIRARRGTLLADDLRTGKTLTALASHDPKQGPLLVVCPLIAREVWLRWIDKVFPGEDVGVMMGTTFERATAEKPIVVVHYDVLKHWQLVRPLGTMILDEAHNLSNAWAKRTLAAVLLASRAEHVVAATGTPVWNRPIGMWSLLNLIAPGAFGSNYLFGQRYCDPQPTAYGTTYKGATNEAELNQRLSTVRIQRKWSDVQANLPPITRSLAIADLTNAQHRAIDIAVAEVQGGTAASLARFRRALGAAKVKPTVEEVLKAIGTGQPVVTWSWHQDVAQKIHDALRKANVPTWLIHGTIPQKQRDLIFPEWRQSCGVLNMTIGVGQVGIDLSHSHLPIFAEIDWTPAMIRQAEMRTYHPSRGMHVTYVTSDHLVERRMVMALHEKLVSAAAVDADVGREAIDILLTGLSNGAQTPDMERLARDLLSADFIE